MRYARDVLGANVLFSNIDLNQLEALMTNIASDISRSSNFIIKMGTDEFLAVYNLDTKLLTTSISAYLSKFTTNEINDLYWVNDTRVSYAQVLFISRDICDKNIYSTLEKILLLNVEKSSDFKAVFNSRMPLGKGAGKRIINLRGHTWSSIKSIKGDTHFGILHFHFRYAEIHDKHCK